MWPTPSPPAAFFDRRRRLQQRLSGPALIASGFARSRNFAANTYPFRASSHFLYLVGRPIPGAALLVEPARTVLYVPALDPADELWTGPEPGLDELAEDLQIEVRPIDEMRGAADFATVSPPDERTASWLRERLGRGVAIAPGELNAEDAALAEALIDLRLVHDEAAIAQLRQAARVTALAHQHGMAKTAPSKREADVRATMEACITRSGMVCAYGSIVTVHGEVLHNERSYGQLSASDLLLCDVGAETPEGWAADVTRTWPVSGRFSATQRELYDVVFEAQLSAIDAVRPGVRFRDVHRVAARRLLDGLIDLGIFEGDADELFESGAHALFFPHGIGHLLGLDVHDMEDLGDRAGYGPGRQRSHSPSERYLRLDRDLAPGMAVTIEPGFYRINSLLNASDELNAARVALNRGKLARFADVRGIRIEDDVLVTGTGREVLTAEIPKAADAIEGRIGSAA